MRNTSSKFVPDESGIVQVDDRIFYSDESINVKSSVDRYRQLIDEGKYTEALKYANQIGLDYTGAWVFNLINNRLVAIKNYLQTRIEKPELVIYTPNDPYSSLPVFEYETLTGDVEAKEQLLGSIDPYSEIESGVKAKHWIGD